jgi:phosphoribosylaminoimidazole-succinocarboxamide synthase
MPPGLRLADRLPEPIFTPAIKNDCGHDENISRVTLAETVGSELALRLEEMSRRLYAFAAGVAEQRGIILADTKFEFGFVTGELTVIDEMVTPDSSRFWDAAAYAPGYEQPSFDKQFVRDWLIRSGWNKQPPAPSLPPEVVAGTAARYAEAFRRLTGESLVFDETRN